MLHFLHCVTLELHCPHTIRINFSCILLVSLIIIYIPSKSHFYCHFSAGSVVILLQKSEDYKVIAVGIVIEVDAHISMPDKHVPVFVAPLVYLYLAVLCFGLQMSLQCTSLQQWKLEKYHRHPIVTLKATFVTSLLQ